MAILIIKVLVFFVLIVPTIYAFWIGAPILLAPKSSIRKGLMYCKVEKGKIFYDLGSGTGRELIVASKEFKLNSMGFELSPILFLISKLNLFLNQTRSRVLMKNFYKADLSGADIIFCFLTSKTMKKLSPKFKKELKNGTKIISYCFKIPNWEPVKIINTDNPGKVFIYEKI